MPLQITYNRQKGILYGVVDAQVKLEELAKAMRNISEANEYPPDVPTLWDLRKLDFTAINKDYLEKLISLRQDNPQRGQARIAIIADEDLGFGISRMYEMLSEGLPQRIMVFRSVDEGEVWLCQRNSI